MVPKLNVHKPLSQAYRLSVINIPGRQEIPKSEILSQLLQDLDLLDLLILRTVCETDGMTAKTIGIKVHLSRSAALKHTKNLVDRELLTSESVIVASGIRPAYLFFPIPELTIKIIDQVITQQEEKKQGMQQQGMNPKIPQVNQLDPLNLVILGLVCLGLAATAREIREATGLSKAPVQSRLRQLLQLNFLIRDQTRPHEHRPSIVEYRYFPTPEVDLELVQQAIDALTPRQLPPSLNSKLLGLLTNSKQPSSSNGLYPKVDFALNEGPQLQQVSQQPNVSTHPEATVSRLWEVVAEMAEAIAALNERFAKIEASLQGRTNINPDDILATIRFVNSDNGKVE